jgi:hypothetical protein
MAKPPSTFASLEGLLDHRQRDGFDIRPTLLRVLTDLYLQKSAHPLEDERYYTELALRLIGSTDVPARAAVAERLAPYPAAPRAVILRLARDVIDVAGAILRHSPCLTQADLAAITADCGTAHAAIIATRLRPPEQQRLREPHEPPKRQQPPEPPSDSSRHGGPHAAELSELFFSSTGAERRHILINLDYATLASPRVTPLRSSEIVGRLETSALAHNVDAFTREVELAFGISSRLARRIVADELGEPIVVVAKALRAPRAVLERILLFVNPRIGQSVQRVYELANRYDEISAEAALRLVAIWQDADPRMQESPRQQSVSRRPAADVVRSASPLATRRPLEQREARPRSLVGR